MRSEQAKSCYNKGEMLAHLAPLTINNLSGRSSMERDQSTLPSWRIKNRVGQRFGKLLVISFAGLNCQQRATWLCRCDCGNEKVIWMSNLRSGHTQTCGCSWTEVLQARNTTHGQSSTRTYKIWIGMLKRCQNPKHIGFALYGGRGIQVCGRWLKFEHFLADMGHCPDGLSIDRVDVNGNYEPANCRWATTQEQSQNRRDRKRYEFNGESLLVSEWSERTGIPTGTLLLRLQRWDIARALTAPMRKMRPRRKPPEAQ